MTFEIYKDYQKVAISGFSQFSINCILIYSHGPYVLATEVCLNHKKINFTADCRISNKKREVQ